MLLAVLYLPAMATAFQFGPLSFSDLLTMLAIGFSSLVGYEFVKQVLGTGHPP